MLYYNFDYNVSAIISAQDATFSTKAIRITTHILHTHLLIYSLLSVLTLKEGILWIPRGPQLSADERRGADNVYHDDCYRLFHRVYFRPGYQWGSLVSVDFWWLS